MKVSRIWALIALVGLALPTTARADENAQLALDISEKLFDEGRYPEVLATLEQLEDSVLNPQQRQDRLKRIAFTFYLMSLYDEARQTWLELKALNPDYALDPVNDSPVFVSFFGRITVPEADADVPDGEVEGPGVVDASGATSCRPWLCAVPAGVGHFAQERHLRGALFLGAELAFLATNIGLNYSRQNDFDDGNNPDFDRDADDDKRLMQNVALGLLVTTVVLEIVDAYWISP